MKNMIHNYPLF